MIRAIPEKNTWEGKTAGDIFFYGWLVQKVFKLYGSKLFVAFPWVETSTGPGGFMICVFINMTGTPEGSTESGFMEKPGIEPATPGLQGIALIHYTTGASQLKKKKKKKKKILYGSKKTFCGFSMGSNQYWAGRVYDRAVDR